MTEHRHGWHPFDGSKPDRPTRDIGCTPIADTVCIRPSIHGHDGAGKVVPNHPAGFVVAHDAADLPQRCEGHVTTDTHLREAHWTQTGTLEDGDLSLAPSVLCTRDGFHGFVRAGKWMST